LSIGKSPLPQLPLYMTEWSASSSSRDPVHDSYISAAFIINSLKSCGSDAQAMSYWTYTDIFEEAGPAPSPFHGGFGLINLEGLHKPSYYAYKYLHQLGDEELACNDASATVCRDKNGVQALFWNYTPLKQDAPNQEFFKRDLPAANLPSVRLVLKNLPGGTYTLKVFGVGHHLNDVYDDYLAMGSPLNPTREQIQKLAEKNSGAPITTEELSISKGGTFDRSLPMSENAAFLVTLNRRVQ
jgi:xylan 1,4-beta-xylosidase